MNVNFVDAAAVGGAAYGAVRGCWRGLSRELMGLIGVAVWLVTGCGLYHWTARGVATVSSLTGHGYGLVGFVAAWIGAVVVMRRMRGHLHGRLQERFPESKTQRIGGAVAGGAKVFLFACILILLAGHLPGFLGKPFNTGSLIGSTLRQLVSPPQKVTHE